MKAALDSVLTGLLCCWVGAGLTPARAQEAPSPTPPEPGYELLAEAGQLAQSSKALAAATEPGASLTQKRLAVSDKPVVQALDAMRRWLDTSGALNTLPDPNGKGLMPILPGVRALARALYVRNYVLLADGRVTEAIEGLRNGVRLSYAIGSDRMVGWLTGIVVETILIKSLATHFDQFSERDCDHLFRLAQEWVNGSDPLPIALERARQAKLTQLQQLTTSEGFRSLIQELDTEDPILASQIEVMPPREIQAMLTRFAAEVNAAYRKGQLALRTPYWERTQPVTPNGEAAPEDPLVAKLMEKAMPDLSRTADRYTQVQATARLLGCHAAIRRYRWEHDRLPSALTDLKIGGMAIDPFSGKPFVYKTDGNAYTLESIGPLARDDNGRVVPNQHVAVTLIN